MRYLVIFLILCVSLFAAGSLVDEDTAHFVGRASAFTVGSEIVTDGDFPSFDNWTQGTWTLAGGVASEDNAGGDSDLTQVIASGLVVGRVYRVQFEVTAYTDGNVTARFDGVEIGDKTATGVYTGYAVSTGTGASIDIRADATFTGSIDNVSVVAWTGHLTPGGGITIAGLKALLDAGGDLTDIMTTTGGIFLTESALETENDGSNKVRIVSGSTWALATVGTLVNVLLSAPLASGEDSGIYEITAATTTKITIDADFAAGGADDAITCEIWVGGAYPDIATCVGAAASSVMADSTFSEDPDGIYRKRYICVNVPQEIDAVTDFIAETSETALREDDGSRKLIGFNDSISVETFGAGGGTYGSRIVSDIDEGGIFYGGAWQAWKSDKGFSDVRPNGKWIEWNAQGNDINILELNTSNFEMRNIKIHNTIADASAEGLVIFDTAVFNTTFTNCWFDTSSRFAVDDAVSSGNSVTDCYFGSALDLVDFADFQDTKLFKCIIDGGARTNCIGNVSGCFFNGSLFYDGLIGVGFVDDARGKAGLANNLFYSQSARCIDVTTANRVLLIYYNNMLIPESGALDNCIRLSNGSLSPAGFNNIMFGADGVAMTNPIVHTQITPNPPLPVGTLEVDPQFVNPADGDFRLRSSSPALNGGLRGLFDGWTTIGANQPYSSPNAGYRSRYNFKGHNYSDR